MVESVLLSVLWMGREVTSECNAKQKKGTKGVMMGHLLKYDSEIERRSRERVYDKCNRKTNTILNKSETHSFYDSGTYELPDI